MCNINYASFFIFAAYPAVVLMKTERREYCFFGKKKKQHTKKKPLTLKSPSDKKEYLLLCSVRRHFCVSAVRITPILRVNDCQTKLLLQMRKNGCAKVKSYRVLFAGKIKINFISFL